MLNRTRTQMTAITLSGAMLALTGLALTGCGQRMGGLRARIEANKLARSIPVQGTPVTVGQITAIDVENPWGDVVIDARPRNEESFIAFKVRKERHLRWRGAWQGFEFDPTGAYFTAEHETNGEVGTVVIRPTDLTVEGFRPPVDIIVYVPRADGIRVRNAGGNVTVVGATGSIDVRSGTEDHLGGDVEIRTDLTLDDLILAESSGGDVKVVAGKDSEGTIELVAPRGETTFDGRYGVTAHSQPKRGHWTGVWNDGINPIRIHSEAGDAVMMIVENPSMYSLKGW